MKNFDELLKKYADFIVRVGVNPQPGQTMIIRCPLEAAPLARLCVRSAYEAGVLRRGRRGELHELLDRELALGDAARVHDRHPVFDTRAAVRDRTEVVTTQSLLLFKTERAVVGTDDAQHAGVEAAPQGLAMFKGA